ncbi:MAG: histidinol-phosphatase HisJ [Promethearchaeota archaeon]
MNKLEDWHTHNYLCRHAVGTLEDYVKKAIKFGLKTIGFSDHFPYEFLKNLERIPYQEYSMTLNEVEGYILTAENLRKKYENQIEIKIGFEIDYLKDQEDALNKHLNKVVHRLDHIYGSVHILNAKKGLYCFDDNRFLEEYNNLGVDNVYMKYYKTQRKMLSSNKFKFDIVSHFDLPKKFNKLPQNKDLIFNEAIKSLELVKKRDLVVEINTSGFRKEVKEQYPSEKIIKEMHQLDIPILLGSDAHDPKEIAWEFKLIIEKLKQIGYNQLAHFNKRKRHYIDL